MRRTTTAIGPAVVLVVLAGCGSGSSGPQPGATTPPATSTPPSATPKPTLGAIPPLRAVAYLGATLSVPTGWPAKATPSSATAGQVEYTGPDRVSNVYVNVSDCAACVDQGLVTTGSANGVADPGAVVAHYSPLTQSAVGSNAVRFRLAALTGYRTDGLVQVTFATAGGITGYVTVEVTLPAGDSAVATRILASVHA